MINTDPNHKYTYDEHGIMTCCSQEDQINQEAEQKLESKGLSSKIRLEEIKEYLPSIVSFILLMIALSLDFLIEQSWFKSYIRLVWYILAYLPVGFPVLLYALKAALNKDVFSEFFLMSLATIGAFSIGQYQEGVAVMLFYSIGELFQSAAVKKAKGNIKALLDIRPNSANVQRNGKTEIVHPNSVQIGEIIQVRSGEKVPLDGVLLNEKGSFNAAALTGESVPDSIYKDKDVLAGMINIGPVVEIQVTKKFSDSSISRILELVENATARKAQTELFIRKFARIYTPIVVLSATLLTVLPVFFTENYVFADWLYRALIFLVISCPCALVISIPLGYFGGIGAASRNGILFKGSNYLDLITKVNTVVMDKTGTLTKGVFKVQKVESNNFSEDEFLSLVAAIEKNSTHPIAKAIVADSLDKGERFIITSVEEISGHGLKGVWNIETILAGNAKLLKKFNVNYPDKIDEIVDSIVLVALNNKYQGYIIVSDEIKPDAIKAIEDLKILSIEPIMLSGDKQSVVSQVANLLGIDKAFGNLLPEHKVENVENLKRDKSKVIAFVGDGINDAPVLALSDIGIAMGGLGSDAAIETADVIIQTDHPSKIATAIYIGKATRKIVWQNIILAFSVKAIVLALGAGGIATMWEAVFADVGVALLAILNSVRIQKMKFK
jgi:Cd2+/Zn2+-exporting ATPase